MNVIRLNDPTSHGGKVDNVAAVHFTVGGVAVARVGDTCNCQLSLRSSVRNTCPALKRGQRRMGT